MTENATAVAAGALPDEGRDPAGMPGTGDYLRGIVAVVGVLVLIVAITWLTLVIAGVDLCGCTTRSPAAPVP